MAAISTCFISYKYPISKPSLAGRSPYVPASVRLRYPQRSADVRVRVSAIRASVDVPAGIRPGRGVETDKLPADVRKRAMDAVDSCGGRVTLGDVASRAGLKLNEAERALQALAADTGGFLEVLNAFFFFFFSKMILLEN